MPKPVFYAHVHGFNPKTRRFDFTLVNQPPRDPRQAIATSGDDYRLVLFPFDVDSMEDRIEYAYSARAVMEVIANQYQLYYSHYSDEQDGTDLCNRIMFEWQQNPHPVA